jgi:hypothetical protein
MLDEILIEMQLGLKVIRSQDSYNGILKSRLKNQRWRYKEPLKCQTFNIRKD